MCTLKNALNENVQGIGFSQDTCRKTLSPRAACSAVLTTGGKHGVGRGWTGTWLPGGGGHTGTEEEFSHFPGISF